MADDLETLLDRWCLSDFDGCSCGLPKNHAPPHHCASPDCTVEWTDEQSAEWWASLQAEIAAGTYDD